MPTVHISGDGHLTPATLGDGTRWEPYTDAALRKTLDRALFILRHNVRSMRPCDDCFSRLPGGRTSSGGIPARRGRGPAPRPSSVGELPAQGRLDAPVPGSSGRRCPRPRGMAVGLRADPGPPRDRMGRLGGRTGR